MEPTCLVWRFQVGRFFFVSFWHIMGSWIPKVFQCHCIIFDHRFIQITHLIMATSSMIMHCHKWQIFTFHKHDSEFKVLQWSFPVTRSESSSCVRMLREIHSMNVKLINLQPWCDAVMTTWTRMPKECFQHSVESMSRRFEVVPKLVTDEGFCTGVCTLNVFWLHEVQVKINTLYRHTLWVCGLLRSWGSSIFWIKQPPSQLSCQSGHWKKRLYL